jgi:hypothetical protein
MSDTIDKVSGWLDTFSQVSTMQDNVAATAKEIETIAGVFDRENCTRPQIDETFRYLKMTTVSRVWPTAAQVYEALRNVRREKTGAIPAGSQKGDRGLLSGVDRGILEGQVLPNCKRWVRTHPGLRDHAIQTLEYWSEPVTDDTGKTYAAARNAK